MAKKKPQALSVTKISIALGAVALLGILTWWWFKSTLPDFVRYDAFGIEIPSDFSIHGIDVSKYQERINWVAVKEMEVDDVQIRFTFIKATEGLGNMDAYFKRNWEKAADAGLPRGGLARRHARRQTAPAQDQTRVGRRMENTRLGFRLVHPACHRKF